MAILPAAFDPSHPGFESPLLSMNSIAPIAWIALAALLAPAGATAADGDGIEAAPADAEAPAPSAPLPLPSYPVNGTYSVTMLAGVDPVGASVGVRAAIGGAVRNVRVDGAASFRGAFGELPVVRGTLEVIVSRASGAVRPWASAGVTAAATQLEGEDLMRLCLKHGGCYDFLESEGASASASGPELAVGINVPIHERALLGVELRFPFANETVLAGIPVRIGGPFLGVALTVRR